MKLNNKCCDALGQRSEIQSELDRLYNYEAFARIVHEYIHGNDLLQPDLATLLTAVRGLVAPEWISADLVTPTEPGWYWVRMGYDTMTPVMAEYCIFPTCQPCWLQPGDFYGSSFAGTHYIKIKKPVVK